MLFFNMMIIGTLISISAYNWMSMWMGLEINLLSIIPLFKSTLNQYSTESMIKYFLTQTLASIFILYIVINMMNKSELMTMNNFLNVMIMNSALLTKLGAAPFHWWFPEVMEGLDWKSNFLLLTWQKIAPSILLMYMMNTSFIMYIIIISSLIGGIMGLNQMSLRKLLTYSSINHMGWMLSSMMFFKTIWLNYFFIYSIINFNMISIFYYFNIYYMNQIHLIFTQNKLLKLMFMMNLFSLGGLPPFLGFYPKWLVLNMLISNQFYFISLILVVLTLITLFYYIRLTFSSLTLSMHEMYLNLNFKKKNILVANLIVLNSLPISMNLFNIL
uniref:NADH-ubiquinone oxidoreductase chain 2 n=1 Tax=Chaetocnema depressa TaxID=1425539 RepID=A0A3G1GPF2_9CUCU|nr:NADH dehydrogenase subunit 2 [Chaetocnema depressa]